MKNPNARPLASRIFALAAFQRGNADVSVAAIAKDRDDIDAMQHYTAEAISDFLSSLRVNDANVEAHFSVAKCLLQFGQLDQAITHLRAALYYAPNHQYAPAYDEIGIIMLASGHPTLDQLYTALQCFQDAQNLDPDSPDYALHLSWAKAMLELVRTTTGPSTEPTTQATTLPATMP
jgi:tetratricopeptide (TPR) repeat protein